jgi:hypothetical protein
VFVVALLAACGSNDEASPFAASGGPDNNGAGGEPQDPRANEFIGDAAAATGDAYRGSPLCHITPATCDPDDDGTKAIAPSAAIACAIASAPDSGIMTDPTGCRLSGPTATPACLQAKLENGDGAKCENGADCAPGFDCVAAGDISYCRRYCCTGSCGNHRSQNGAETFCDVQKLAGATNNAPVCMPIKTCKLFTPGECTETETCSVVTDAGTTGCVANGTAKAGESCDQEHCDAGLTCLGQAGSRKCFQLCRTTKTGPSCAANQICKTSTIFMDPTIGVCTPDQ